MKNSISQKTAALLEIAINRVLPLDPDYLDKMQGLAGNIVTINLTDLQMQYYFLADQQQFVVLHDFQGKVNATFSGTGLDIFRIGINHASSNGSILEDSRIHFEGDLAIGQKFAQLFAELNIDWESELATVTGDTFAHHALNIARHTGNWLVGVFGGMQRDISQYLHEDLHITPTQSEVTAFYTDVSHVVADSKSLLATFQRIEEQLIDAQKHRDTS